MLIGSSRRLADAPLYWRCCGPHVVRCSCIALPSAAFHAMPSSSHASRPKAYLRGMCGEQPPHLCYDVLPGALLLDLVVRGCGGVRVWLPFA